MGREEEDVKLFRAGVNRPEKLLREDGQNRNRCSEGSTKTLSGREVDSLLAEVDLLSLQSLKLEQRKKLPNLAGVYFVLNDKDECLYIGMTESLVLRWLSHHRLKELQKLEGIRIAWLEWEDTESLNQAESFFLRALRPLLNANGLKPIKVPKQRTNNSSLQFELLFTDEQNELLKLSLSDLSKRTKVNIATWSRWLNGMRSPTLDTLRGVASILEMLLLEFIEVFEERRSRTMERNGKKTA